MASRGLGAREGDLTGSVIDGGTLEIQTVGILHPGEMGISVAASVQVGGHSVYWVSQGRSPKSRERAEKYRLLEAASMDDLCRRCDLIVSVCPPHAAEDVAQQVLAASFRGTYLDANAISPQRAGRIGGMMERAGVEFVDGGIIGGPAWESGRTWLYLSGKEATKVATVFASGPLETAVVGEAIGRASALKMCFAAYTKGTSALLSAILAAAEASGVRPELESQWSRSWPGFAEQTEDRVRRVTAKAWRFEGEMEEIATTFAGVGLPAGFYQAAGQIYSRMAKFKDAPATPSLDEVLSALAP
jgi:3-hydroxyisobutyrate dehydrogenase-like beta-hydroxyacid dehydrogenase